MNLTDIISTKAGNSLTKYPSIPTFHKMGDRGCLSEELFEDVSEISQETLYTTKKIDGENTRILIFNDDYIIGAREDWLYAKGDRAIPNGQRKKIEFLKKVAEEILEKGRFAKDTLYCFYGELHGYKVQKSWKRYTSDESYGFRLFDIWEMPEKEVDELLKKSENELSNWRENNQQPWLSVNSLAGWSKVAGISLVPFCQFTEIDEIGVEIQDTYQYLQQFSATHINLDGSEKKNNKAEGIVVRTADRKHIFKIRFEDYEKTLKYRKQILEKVTQAVDMQEVKKKINQAIENAGF